ncbi:MAG: hypothetical protein KatS3mg131_0026 [Candidatus Tectimicrobiota bacterium]|nr:MAG: hypothetical protein KatS3mg131_0026 [Candidatus Tectomicrobia bacterium]
MHVLAGKRHAQEEFFHTFNALYEAGRQIVLAGDRPPQEITALEARLRSRFAAGLLADLQPPDLETRLAILCRKAEACGVRLPHEAALCIASPLHDVRDLERCLRRLVTHASLHAGTITPELATTVVEQLQAERAQAITAPRIQHAVAAYFGLRAGELTSKSRQRTVTFPRQIAMFLCRELTGASLPEIGQHFGGKDHTTVLHACTKIARLEEEDARVARILQQLRHTLGGPL